MDIGINIFTFEDHLDDFKETHSWMIWLKLHRSSTIKPFSPPATAVTSVRKVILKIEKIETKGLLSGSVGWDTNSWFWFRLSSQGWQTEPVLAQAGLEDCFCSQKKDREKKKFRMDLKFLKWHEKQGCMSACLVEQIREATYLQKFIISFLWFPNKSRECLWTL